MMQVADSRRGGRRRRSAAVLVALCLLAAGGALGVADSPDGDDNGLDLVAGLPLDAGCKLPPPTEAASLHLATPRGPAPQPPPASASFLRAPPSA